MLHSLDGPKAVCSADIFLSGACAIVKKKHPFLPWLTVCQLFTGDLISFSWASGLQWHQRLSPGLLDHSALGHCINPKPLRAGKNLDWFVMVEAGQGQSGEWGVFYFYRVKVSRGFQKSSIFLCDVVPLEDIALITIPCKIRTPSPAFPALIQGCLSVSVLNLGRSTDWS